MNEQSALHTNGQKQSQVVSPDTEIEIMVSHGDARSLLTDLGGILTRTCRELKSPLELVERCAPIISHLVSENSEAVKELIDELEWPAQGDESYARQRLAACPEESWSIYAICWRPGQYTPVHDHGTWGVVSVLEGQLYEHLFSQALPLREDEYKLTPIGVTVLTPGAVNTFIPEPDHIHRSGVPAWGKPTVSIHIYGKVMTSYHMYDLDRHTRARLDVE